MTNNLGGGNVFGNYFNKLDLQKENLMWHKQSKHITTKKNNRGSKEVGRELE